MIEIQRINSIVGGGTYAASFMPWLRRECDAMGATPTILTQGRFELNRVTSDEATNFGRDGVIDISPKPQDIRNAIGFLGDEDLAEANRSYWQGLVHQMSNDLIQAYRTHRIVDGQILNFIGLGTGHGKPAAEFLEEIVTRMPRLTIVNDVVIADQYAARREAPNRTGLFLDWKAKGTVVNNILTDNAGPFAKKYGLLTQDQFKAKSLAAMLTSSYQFSQNKALAEAAKALGKDGAPWIGMAFASRDVPVLNTYPGWNFVRKFFGNLPDRGSSDLESIVTEATLATESVLNDRTARAIDEPIVLDRLVYLLYVIPLPVSSRLWPALSDSIRKFLSLKYPKCTPIFVSGAGAAVPGLPKSYCIQVVSFFSIPEVPKVIREIAVDNEQARRDLRPPGRSPNGRASATTFTPGEAK